MPNRTLNGKGAVDYDYQHDILFFKIINREYSRSIELDNIVIDIDKEDFTVGIQIFEASKFLNTEKKILREIKNWRYIGTIKEEVIEVRLIFNVIVRNKTIEKNPIIIQSLSEPLACSEITCVA